MTLREKIIEFHRLHLSQLRSGADTYKHMLLHLDILLDRPFCELTRRDFALWQAHAGVLHGRHAANRTLAFLRLLYNKGIEWDTYHGANPCAGLKRFKVESRHRTLLPGEETHRLLLAIQTEAPFITQPVFLLALTTGPRLGEMLKMQWDHVVWDPASPECGLWRKPRTKTTPHLTFIPTPVMDHLRRLPHRCAYVFSTRHNRPLLRSYIERVWGRVRTAAGCPDLRIHDLRRTFASDLQASGEALDVIQHGLNHSSIQTTEIYLVHRGVRARLKEAIDRQAGRLLGSEPARQVEQKQDYSDCA